MRIFIELPTWLGDSVMASVAIENIVTNIPAAKIVFFGSSVSTELYKHHPNAIEIIEDQSKKSFLRYFWLSKKIDELDEFDLAISFRSHFSSKFILNMIKAKKKIIFKSKKTKTHQVNQYLEFVNLNLNLLPINTEQRIYFARQDLQIKGKKELLGINPGATYGSAKRWPPEYFASVAQTFSDRFDIVIFGSNKEKEMCDRIEQILNEQSVNSINLCGKTTINELANALSQLDLFITNDSGPMHLAASFKIPMIAIFGSTRYDQTAPYGNMRARVLHLDLPCMPCMKRKCPQKNHACMKDLTPNLVVTAIRRLLNMDDQIRLSH
nr:lipopolysaccharide heptosyltransferase II [Campylobacter sp.]